MPFDPSSIPPYSVIRVPVVFDGNRVFKRFVILSHVNGHAYVIKPTHHVEQFTCNQKWADGVVMYKAGELQVFEQATAVDPSNQFVIPHKELVDDYEKGEFEMLGTLPPEFEADLRDAIEDSVKLSPDRKKRLLAQLPPLA